MDIVMLKSFPFIAVMALTRVLFAQDNVQVALGDVKDTRTTGTFFAGLEIQLKVIGDALEDASSVRAVVKSCTDDTGRDLIDPEKNERDFTKVHSGTNTTLPLKLKNPARKSVSIPQLSGELELFVPKKDPAASI